ncbi:hypothetical protein [Streptomyces sp. NPDC059009]|uniref:hypothetical protein n=1 Tax=Streptomyces sp. NPDC059009 TaxID=3346694 RepID=UPI0036C2B4E9
MKFRFALAGGLLAASALTLTACNGDKGETSTPPTSHAPSESPKSAGQKAREKAREAEKKGRELGREAEEKAREAGREAERKGRETGQKWREYGENHRR